MDPDPAIAGRLGVLLEAFKIEAGGGELADVDDTTILRVVYIASSADLVLHEIQVVSSPVQSK